MSDHRSWLISALLLDLFCYQIRSKDRELMRFQHAKKINHIWVAYRSRNLLNWGFNPFLLGLSEPRY